MWKYVCILALLMCIAIHIRQDWYGLAQQVQYTNPELCLQYARQAYIYDKTIPVAITYVKCAYSSRKYDEGRTVLYTSLLQYTELIQLSSLYENIPDAQP